MRRFWQCGVLCCLFLFLSAQAPAPSPKLPPAPEAPPFTGNTLEVVLIASGGLGSPLDDAPKINTVRAALKVAIAAVPLDTAVALRVSGHRVAQDQPLQSCDDSELLLGPTVGGGESLLQKLEGVAVVGNRSVAKSLSHAIVDLKDQVGPKQILMITDGAEGCIDQDPTQFLAASTLAGSGYAIHVLGITLTEEAVVQLKNLADTTGGAFANATSTVEVSQFLTQLIQRAAGASAAPAATPESVPSSPPTPAPGLAEEAPPTPEPSPAPEPSPTPAVPAPIATPEPIVPTAPTMEEPVPATPPPPELEPEPRTPPSVGPAPLPFDPKKFRRQLVSDILKNLPQPKDPPPPEKPKTFSILALIIMGVEALLLLVSLVAIVMLLLQLRATRAAPLEEASND